MSKEILYVVDAVSNEKNVDPEIIFDAVESALATATRKRFGMEMDVRVTIDRESGEYDTFRRWQVVDDEDPEFESPERQILLSYAKDKGLDADIGDFIEEQIDSVEFGRIAAQTAKQVIVQRVRQAERERIVAAFMDRIGQLVLGTVKRTDRRGIVLDMGENAEAIIPREEMIPRENARVGDRMRGLLKEIREDARGPQMIVSRTDNKFLIELLKLEVPEIGQELIDIMGAARDPGSRAKIAVRANVPNLDPIGACVGMRGSRVQTVSNELAGERIDIILWNENPAQFVINAMAPAEVKGIVVDEDKHSMDIAVEDDKLSLAIGRGGQNVRLASELTGWDLNVMDEAAAEEKSELESKETLQVFVEQLDVDEEVALILVQEGFTSVEEVAYVPRQELLDIDEFEESIVDELRSRAQDSLLTKAIATEEKLDGKTPSAELKEMEGVTPELALEMAGHDILTVDDVADQSVGDLMDVQGMNEELAAKLIMKARESWFDEEEASE